ncbi:class I SAM-dependent methyltransferase [Candidatus Shapirobacteria bacterium]|nr:class I SAM-dependent methyltransferase [Candidatus Shapirobacteria bacterium]
MKLLNWLSKKLLDRINYREYLMPAFDKQNERPVEYSFVFAQIAKYYPKKILDVGTGLTALPHLMANCGCQVTAVDNIRDYWPKDMFNRHFWVIDDDIQKSKLEEKFDMITCVSTLEHIGDYSQAVAEMVRLLARKGHLVLTFPYNEKKGVENVYLLKGTNAKELPKYGTRAFCRDNIRIWEKTYNVKVVGQEYWQFFDGDYWTVGKMELPPRKVTSGERHQISCIVLEKK